MVLNFISDTVVRGITLLVWGKGEVNESVNLKNPTVYLKTRSDGLVKKLLLPVLLQQLDLDIEGTFFFLGCHKLEKNMFVER